MASENQGNSIGIPYLGKPGKAEKQKNKKSNPIPKPNVQVWPGFMVLTDFWLELLMDFENLRNSITRGASKTREATNLTKI